MDPQNKQKKILLQAYNIENNDINSNESNLFQVLIKKLSGDSLASERRLPLNTTSNQEDLLSDYSLYQDGIFGVMLRIAPSDTLATIPDYYFQGKTFKLEPVSSEKESSLSVLNTSYFFVGKKYIISTLPPSQIRRLQIYFNFLLSFDGKESNYIFTPTISIPEGIKLSEMKEFILGDQCAIPAKQGKSEPPQDTNYKVLDVASEVLKQLVEVVPNLNDLKKNNILNARLLISFSKPRKMTEEDYKKALSSFIKPIADIDDVKIKLKNKKTYKGKEVLRTKEIKIEQIDSVRINERELELEMKDFLKELES